MGTDIDEGRSRLDDLIARAQKREVPVPGVAHTMAARLAWIQNDFDRASRLHQAALEEYRRSGTLRDEAMALNNLGTVAHRQTHYERAAHYYEQAVARARDSSSPAALAIPLGNLGVIAMQQTGYVRAATLLDEAVELYREIGDEQRLAIMLSNRGDLAYRQGNSEEAVALHHEALAMKREMDDGLSIATSLGDLALAHIDLGDDTEAEPLLREALGVFMRAGQKDGVAEAVQAMGRIAQKRGELGLAVHLYAGSEALRDELGIKVHPADRERYDRAIAKLKTALPETELRHEWEQGRRLSIEELVKEAGGAPGAEPGQSSAALARGHRAGAQA